MSQGARGRQFRERPVPGGGGGGGSGGKERPVEN